MNLRTYRAYTLQQALDAVRQDLGPGAVILRTTTSRQGGFMGLGARTVVEVTASGAAEPPVFRTSPPTLRPRPRPQPAARPKAAGQGEAADRDEAAGDRREPMPVPPVAGRDSAGRGSRPAGDGTAAAPPESPPTPALTPTPTPRPAVAAEPPALDLDAERRRTRALARRMLADHERRARELAARETEPARSSAAVPERPVTEAPASVPPPSPVGESRPEPPASEPVAVVVPAAPAERSYPVADAATGGSGGSGGSGGRVGRPPTRVRDEELEAIGGLVGEVLRGRHRRGPLPPAFFACELALLAGEMSREFAESVIDEAMAGAGPEAIAHASEEAAAAAVRRRLAGRVPVAEEALPARSPDARPLTVAFVGPTGVGKTTSIAKLAAALRLRHRLSVGLITADTYRIAAVEQLRTYADIIGVPLRVAMDARAMRQATLELADRDVILIDTAGRSQRDERRIDELREMVDAADPHEVHLVLSAIAGPRALRREAAAFSAVGTRKLVLTKLDEAVSFGMLIEATAGIGLPLSFLTTGQEVPEDLERATAARLADLALDEVSAAAESAAGSGAQSGAARPVDGGRR